MSSRHDRKRQAIIDDSARHDRWLLSYADFVTLLLAVFVLLAASAWQRHSIGSVSSAIQTGFQALGAAPPADVQPPPSPATPVEQVTAPSACESTSCTPEVAPEQLESELRSALGTALDDKEVVLQSTTDGVVITLRELGLFRSGEARLFPRAVDKLLSIAAVLKQRNVNLRVEGHSDDQPIHSDLYRSNWELSTARAMSVVSTLVDQAAYPPERISAAGYGPYRPVTTNATPEGRSINRRIDLVVTTRAQVPPQKLEKDEVQRSPDR